MIVAIDVYYYDDRAKVSAILFRNWIDAEPAQTHSLFVDGVAAYEPGAFYKRELPCISAILAALSAEAIELIIVDGYVYLDDTKKAGLGGHLYDMLEQKIPVIGVAKTFFTNSNLIMPLQRGNSKNPLYISAAGIQLDEAVACIRAMDGDFRMPTLLKRLDRETRLL